MRSFRHLSLRYIWNRYGAWRYSRNNMDAPMLVGTAVEVLKTYLLPTDVGAEFGSGRSTVFFAKRVKHLTSVESSIIWYERVQAMLESGLVSERVTLLLRDDLGKGINYLESLFNDNSLDFVLVDSAKLRDQYALAMLSYIRPGGLLIIDNIERYLPNKSIAPASIRENFRSDKWKDFYDRTQTWRQIWFSNGVMDTAFWFKPELI